MASTLDDDEPRPKHPGFDVEPIVMKMWAPPRCRGGCGREASLGISVPMLSADGRIVDRGFEVNICRPCALALGAKLLGETL